MSAARCPGSLDRPVPHPFNDREGICGLCAGVFTLTSSGRLPEHSHTGPLAVPSSDPSGGGVGAVVVVLALIFVLWVGSSVFNACEAQSSCSGAVTPCAGP